MKKHTVNKTTMKKILKQFLKDESGQSTTEYVLLLLFIVVAVSKVGGGLKTKLSSLMDKIFDKTDAAVDSVGE